MSAPVIRWFPEVRRWPLPVCACTCGCKAIHVVSRKRTFDGKVVLLASDGTIAVDWKRIARADITVGWLVMADVETFDADEINWFIIHKAARGAVGRV